MVQVHDRTVSHTNGRSAVVERQSIEEVRRAELIDATVMTIAERGFHRTTVRDIARAAGASPASVLYYFASKDELLAAAFEVLSPNGGVRVSLPPPYVHHRSATLTVDRLENGRPSHRTVEGGFEVAFSRELRHFHRAITRGEVATSDAGHARADARWCQAMVASAAARYGIVLGGEASAR